MCIATDLIKIAQLIIMICAHKYVHNNKNKHWKTPFPSIFNANFLSTYKKSDAMSNFYSLKIHSRYGTM